MKTILSTLATLVISAVVALPASTGFIEGIIKAIEGDSFVVEGVNHYGHQEGEQSVAAHKIPNKGTPVYILDGRITTKDAALTVGRKCFVFWNRHTQQMVVVRSGADEAKVVVPAGPVPEGEVVHTTQGIIKSATPEAVVFTVMVDGAEQEKTVPLNKTGFILDNKFGSTFEEVCVVGRHAVAFCYRNREYPNFVVSGSDVEPAAE